MKNRQTFSSSPLLIVFGNTCKDRMKVLTAHILLQNNHCLSLQTEKSASLTVPLSQLPSHSSSNSPSVVPSAIQPTAPSVSVLDLPATAKVAEILKSSQDYECLEDMHFVSVTDSGGQAPFIDIAPSLFPYNSINLVVFKLNESLDSEITFSYSIDGDMVGSEKRKISTEQLILAAVSSKTRVKRPNIRGVVSMDSCEKPHCMALGTHYDVYRKKEGCRKFRNTGIARMNGWKLV